MSECAYFLLLEFMLVCMHACACEHGQRERGRDQRGREKGGERGGGVLLDDKMPHPFTLEKFSDLQLCAKHLQAHGNPVEIHTVTPRMMSVERLLGYVDAGSSHRCVR